MDQVRGGEESQDQHRLPSQSGLKLCLLRHRMVFIPQGPLSLRLSRSAHSNTARFPCPGVVLTVRGWEKWEKGRESGNQFTESCGHFYAKLTFFFFHWDVVILKNVLVSSPSKYQSNCKIWVHRGGEKICDYPKCKMAIGHLWGKAVVVGVLEGRNKNTGDIWG